MSNGVPLNRQRKPYKLLLRQSQCPGDVLACTAVVDCLKRQFPFFRIGTQTTCPEVWENNPHVEKLIPGECAIVEMDCPLIKNANMLPIHYLGAFVDDVAKKLNVPLVLDINRPSLYLSDLETQRVPCGLSGKFALVNSGTKQDFTVKGAGTKIYQEVIEAFPDVHWVQVGAKEHNHKKLKGVTSLVGKTTIRELIVLAYHSTFGIGAESFLHHVYAAFQKPFVCYLGGRVPLSWISYPNAIMLNSLGELSCCESGGCFKRRVVPLNDNHHFDRSLCSFPVVSGEEVVPKCLEMIGAKPAITAIEGILA